MLTALVTGASRGIGAAIAKKLAQRGVRVIMHARTASPQLAQTHQSLAHPELKHETILADLRDTAQVESLCSDLRGRGVMVDILVNNAGIYALHRIPEDGVEEWDRGFTETINANLIAPALLSQRVARAMQSQATQGAFGRGRMINITSRGAFRGEPEAPGYGAAKAGLNAFGQSLAKALAKEHIYTFTIAPGWVATDMATPHLNGPQGSSILDQHPLGRVASVDELADLTAFCALDAPATMTGCVIDINGASYLRT